MKNKIYTYDYPMPSITTDIIVNRECTNGKNEILLIKRKNEPFKDCWALPGGFLEMDEFLNECASRELREETGIHVSPSDLEQLTILDNPLRDSRGRVISVVYACSVNEAIEVKASDDAKDYKWFSVYDLPDNLAFDHKTAINVFMTL